MSVLVDRHHAGLFHSLQLLFEDRLGIPVFTPIGPEWWDEGYWNFGRGHWGDDRLARQFLNAEPFTDGVAADPEFPDRDIHGVTLAQAREMTWTAVVATVDDNQRGFARFATEHGARYFYQVGNIYQPVQYALNPVVLNSTAAPFSGISIGQEFDSDGMFGFRPPQRTGRIASFVNCFPSTPCYGVMQATERELGSRVAVHGIDGPDGNVKPIAALADAMEASDFAWHDKVQGDGFGHVIHYWAAIGRPLIGHASHYAGTLAADLWRDGETCIDLDRHSTGDVARLVREIGDDPERHHAMCLAIREVFDRRIDWARDAERVRNVL